jgi:branched-chain amino acid transport system substrate-binding protein
VPAGAVRTATRPITFHAVGDDFPIYDDLRTHVVDKGLAAGDGSNLGTVLYNRGVVAAMLGRRGRATAQEIHGTKDITPPMMRDGYGGAGGRRGAAGRAGPAGFTGRSASPAPTMAARASA